MITKSQNLISTQTRTQQQQWALYTFTQFREHTRFKGIKQALLQAIPQWLQRAHPQSPAEPLTQQTASEDLSAQ